MPGSPARISAGYDRSFEEIVADARRRRLADRAGAVGHDLLEAAVVAGGDERRQHGRVATVGDPPRVDGQLDQVSSETADLVELAVDAWRVTDGRFDPTVLPALVAAGYDRSFEEIVADGPGPVGEPAPAAGGEGVVVDHQARTVAMPAGVQLDLGGIGKGRAADLVATELLEAGAEGACVNLGGDVRLVGEPPGGTGWLVGIEHPLDGELIVTLALREGAVATSTTAHRRWADDAHHIIDPATGRPARSDLVSVTIVAGEAAWAEVVAKAALLAGFDAAPALVERLGSHRASLVDTYGKAWSLPGLEAYAA